MHTHIIIIFSMIEKLAEKFWIVVAYIIIDCVGSPRD